MFVCVSLFLSSFLPFLLSCFLSFCLLFLVYFVLCVLVWLCSVVFVVIFVVVCGVVLLLLLFVYLFALFCLVDCFFVSSWLLVFFFCFRWGDGCARFGSIRNSSESLHPSQGLAQMRPNGFVVCRSILRQGWGFCRAKTSKATGCLPHLLPIEDSILLGCFSHHAQAVDRGYGG